MVAEQEGKCDFCRAGFVDPALGECDICGRKVQKTETHGNETQKPLKRRNGGYGSMYLRQKRNDRLRLAHRLAMSGTR